MVNLKKQNKVAILFSNEALSAFNAFRFGMGGSRDTYNDILRPFYDALYRMNVGVDFVDPSSSNIEDYRLLVVPLLYAAPDSLLQRLNRFVKNGGHIVYTFKSGFADQYVKVRTTRQPGIISEACGVTYSQFTLPQNVSLKGDPFGVGSDNKVTTWMELLTPTTAKVLASYDHPVWGQYAAITQNSYGKCVATFIGCMTSSAVTERILADAVKKAGLWSEAQSLHYPIITKEGVNEGGKTVRYLFNYSAKPATVNYVFASGHELLSNEPVSKNKSLEMEPWGVKIIERE